MGCADHGPQRGARDDVTPHTRPPADDDGDPHAWCGRCCAFEGKIEIELVCRAGVRLRGAPPQSGRWVDGDRHTADASGSGRTNPAADRHGRSESRANGVRAPPHTLEQGEQLYCSLSWAEDLASPQDIDEANRADSPPRGDTGAAGWGGRGSPDHRFRDPIQRSAAYDQRPHLYADRGRPWRRSPTNRLPEDGPAGERNWDYRLQPGCGTRPSPSRHCTTWNSTGRPMSSCSSWADPGGQRRRRPADHVRGSTAGATLNRVFPRGPSSGYGGGASPGADRQWRLRTSAKTDVFGAVPGLDPAAHAAAVSACPGRAVADRPVAGPSVRPRSGRSPTRGIWGGSR